MSNTSLKKNPFLSIWLSSANLLAGSFRAPAIAQTGREVNPAVTESTNETMRSWCAALTPPAKKRTAPRNR